MSSSSSLQRCSAAAVVAGPAFRAIPLEMAPLLPLLHRHFFFFPGLFCAYSDAADGYGITECGSLACLSNPCRNGARCVEVQPKRSKDNDEEDSDSDNSIGLSSLNRNQRHREWLRSDAAAKSASGLIPRHSSIMHGAEASYTETDSEDRNWQCKCPTGYVGPTCEISVCDNNPCQYGGTCIPYPGSGYLCLCPFGKHGHYCEHSE